MDSTRLAFTVLAAACVAAAAGGGYLATRQNTDSVVPVSSVAAPEQVTAAAQPVKETEALVGEPAPGVQPVLPPTPVEAPASAPTANRRETLARPPARPARSAAGGTTRSSQPPPLERTWPSSAASAPAVPESPTAPVETPTPPAPIEERAAADPVSRPEPPERLFEELVVSADSVIGLQTESAISSERARVEDRIEARVVRDVRVGGAVAIPAGSRAIGSVMLVERGGKFKERARLGIRFHTLVLADGTRLPITTETIHRYGEPPGNSSAAKIGGGAVAGAILGAILGGAKGAAVGATTGAGAGTAAVVAADRSAAEFPAGTEVTARILSPVTVTIEK